MRISHFACQLFAAMLVSFAPSAFAATIDFDGLNSTSLQPVPLTSFTEDGYSFGLTFSGPTDGPAIFDTTCAGYGPGCNGDIDLVPLVQGQNGVADNILIAQDNVSWKPTPNDDANGHSIFLELTGGPAFRFAGASAVDDGTFKFYSIIGGLETLLGQIIIGNDRLTGSTTFLSAVINIGDQIRISYSGSGGVDSLVLAPVPIPAALPLFGSALAGMGLLGWRRKRNAAA